MRTASVLLALCLASTVSAFSFVDAYMATTHDAVEFLRGFTKGLIGEDLGEDLGQCITEGSDLVGDLVTAVSEIEQGGIENIVGGIYQFVTIIKEIPQVFGDCKSISLSALAKLEAFGARFTDLNSLLQKVSMNMLFHGTEILNDFHEAKTYIDTAQYFNAGLFGGLAISVATQ